MRFTNSVSKRIAAFALSILMLISAVPVSAFPVAAAATTSLETDLTDVYYVGKQAEIYFTTNASDEDAGALVLGNFTLTDEAGESAQSAVETLEYLDVSDNSWKSFYGDFGPAATGFPLTDGAQSHFRVKFNKTGTYFLTVSIIDFNTRIALTTLEKEIEVRDPQSELKTNIAEQKFEVQKPVGFYYKTVANADKDTLVVGTFEITDSADNNAEYAYESLEYKDDAGVWHAFNGDFGPPTGFLLENATSEFRVTFKTAGTYYVHVAIKTVGDGRILCENNQKIIVSKKKAELSTDIEGKPFEVNAPVKFNYKTTANDYVNTTVIGKFSVTDTVSGEDATQTIASLKYLDEADQTWKPFNGDFGPATGFPLGDVESQFEAAFNAAGKYTITVSVVDVNNDANVIASITSDITVLSAEAPVITAVSSSNTELTNQNITVTVTADDNGGNERLMYCVKGGKWEQASDWQESNKFEIEENGTYTFYVKDAAENSSQYTFEVSNIDKEAPVISVENDDKWKTAGTAIDGTATDASVITGATYNNGCGDSGDLTINEEGKWSFTPNVTVSGKYTYTITAVDELENKSTTTFNVKIDMDKPSLNVVNPTEWTNKAVTVSVDEVADDHSGIDRVYYVIDGGKDEHPIDANEEGKYEIPLPAEDNNSTYTITCVDKAGNEASAKYTAMIDVTPPAEPQITYEEAVAVKLLETITFGFYKAKTTVTIFTSDELSGIKGIRYKLGEDEYSLAYSDGVEEDGILKFKISVEPQAKHEISAVAVDNAGNESDATTTGHDGKHTEDIQGIIVDEKDPSRTVEFSPANRVVNAATLEDIDLAEYDYTAESTGAILYYKDTATATIQITEDNFYPEDVTVCDNDNVVECTWNSENNVHTATVKISEEGDHVITIKGYADRSTNPMPDYTSQKIVIDRTAPEISQITFNDGAIKNTTDDGRIYFQTAQTGTLRIKEHNFRADDVVIRVHATDVNGDNVNVKEFTFTDNEVQEYLEQGINRDKWTKVDDDTYEIELEFAADANYTFDVEYKDLATNQAADYAEDKFTIDKTAPSELTVTAKATALGTVTEILTFGFYNAPLSVTATASDDTAGIKQIGYKIEGTKGKDNPTDVEKEEIKEPDQNGSISFTIDPQYRGNLVVTAYDYSDNATSTKEYKDEAGKRYTGIIVDEKDPSRTVKFSPANRVVNAATLEDIDLAEYDYTAESTGAILYYKDTATATIQITEDNFYPEDVTVCDNDNVVECTWNSENNVHTATVKISEEGDHVITIKGYADRSTNPMPDYTSQKIVIDRTAPEISQITFNDGAIKNTTDDGRIYFQTAQTGTLRIKEHNFRADDVVIRVHATDVNGDNVNVKEFTFTDNEVQEYLEQGINRDKWTKVDDDTYEIELEFAADANYTFDVEYKDLATNQAADYAEDKFTIDKTAPSELTVTAKATALGTVTEILTFGFYNAPLSVTATASDDTAGIKQIGYKIEGTKGKDNPTDVEKEEIKEPDQNGSISFTIDPQYRGNLVVTAYDYSDNATSTKEYKDEAGKRYTGIIVDEKDPSRTVKFSPANRVVNAATLEDIDLAEYDYTAESTGAILYYKDTATATIQITEDNFYPEDVTVRDNDNEVECTWNSENNVHTATVKISEEGDHVITIKGYADRSTNPMPDYTSQKIVIDRTAPEISQITFNDGAIKNTTDDGRIYFQTAQTGTLRIKEHNFRADDVVIRVHATDVNGDNVNVKEFTFTDNEVQEYLEQGINRDKWTKVDDDTYEIELEFAADANYTFDVEYKDLATNQAADYAEDKFTIDKTAPSELTVTAKATALGTVTEILTFGFYNAPLSVTATASDDTAGIKQIGYKIEGTKGKDNPTDVEKEEIKEPDQNGSISFTIDPQYRGNLVVTAYDYSDNATSTKEYKDEAGKRYTGIIVDEKDPSRTVKFSPANRVVNAATLEDIDLAEYDYTAESTGAILYYKDTATATIQITEDNFYPEDVTVCDNDNVVECTWNSENNVHTATVKISEEGDHVITIKDYADRSTNPMPDYTSQKIVIDRNAPVINVAFDPDLNGENCNIVSDSVGVRYYFKGTKQTTATIMIEEHNFRADDVVIKVRATDANGNNVKEFTFKDNEVQEYLTQGSSRKKWAEQTPYAEGTWRRSDNKYKLDVVFSADANYTFDVEYEDLATNQAADYAEDKFTIDKVDPTLAITYEKKVNALEDIIRKVTFGFYQPKVTVTLTSEDATAGIDYFEWQYFKEDGTSALNAPTGDVNTVELSDCKTGSSAASASYSFDIPADARGHIEASVYDKSTRVVTVNDDENIFVVDDTNPTSQVTLNEPVQIVDNVSYYDGNITATITINEANFFREDVKVSVTRNGETYPVTTTWQDNNVDVHVGTFTLSDDGDYFINVNYTDRSGNAMAPYESEQLTIDSKEPMITVSGVKHQSANNDEMVTITVSASDTNIALESFKPELSAVIKKATGDNTFKFETIPVDLGTPVTTTGDDGDTVYSYTVENLDADGFYSVVCTAVDYANHSVSLMSSTDVTGKAVAVDCVNFSVNREGSVFWVETEHNDKYTDETFTNQLDGGYANDKVTVKLHEINVDKVNERADKQTVFTLNDGSEAEDIILTERKNGTGNYDKNVSVGSGGWYENIYTLDNENFDHDGVYSLNIMTYDSADNSNLNTKCETGTISFTLDRTAPEISSNISNGLIVSSDEYKVEFVIDEVNLNSESVTVMLTNRDGKVIETNLEELASNRYGFTVEGANTAYTVEIAAKDLAGNESAPYKVEPLTVSTNWFVLFYANQPLFWATIAGIILLIGLIIIFIILKRRKKSEK